MKIKSVMQHQFSQIPNANIERSKFNRSRGYKTTFNSGYLVPFLVDMAVPGDTFNVTVTALARIATLLKPIMDNMFFDTFFFSIPLRLVWDNFTKFMGEKENPDDNTEYVIPTLTATASTGYAEESIFDYMGLPTKVPGYEHSALPLRAYNRVWNEWFRDQNLIDSIDVELGDSGDTPADYTLKRRGKRHDYFTSCLPWPQKGDSVLLPLGDSAPVQGIGKQSQVFTSGSLQVYESGGGSPTYTKYTYIDPGATNTNYVIEGETRGGSDYPKIIADLSAATAATINELRQAFQIQRQLEREARGGTRYVEIIRSCFNVVTPSAGWRTEYLGGGSTPVNINPVVQNSASETNKPQGNLAAIGTIHARHGFTKSFTEHCIILGLLNVRADLTYQNGLDRMWSYSTKYDFYWPSLSHLGEQAVLNKEINCKGTGDTIDDDVFGYQERYAEMRYANSKITGKFKSNASASLDVFHLSQEFADTPALDETFIEENPPVSRVIAIDTEPEFILDMYINEITARPMPVYSVPGLIDHL